MVAGTQELQKSQPETAAVQTLAPRADIYEGAEAFTIHLDLPGVAEEDLEVSVENNVLHLSGKTAAAPQDYKLVYAEYGAASYQRRFALDDRIDAEKIQARLQGGVLTLSLPKRQGAVARQIAINAA